ncbi:MAG: EAL domain-containing protein [Magnetococcus sp. DMHC-6]
METINKFQEDQLIFAEEAEHLSEDNLLLSNENLSAKSWKVLVVDDDEDIHNLTRVVLRGFTFEGSPLTLLNGYSGEEAILLMNQHPDVALILLDVVMESDQSGLEVVRRVREELDNQIVRIVLRTGQPGQAPEMAIIAKYEIDGYKEKSDLSDKDLITTVTIGLRAFRDLQALEEAKKALDHHQRRLLRAQKIAHLGHWEWNVQSDRWCWSEEIYQILGLHRPSSPPTLATLFGATHLEDLERRRQAFDATLHHHTPYNLEIRIVQPDDSVRFVHEQAEVVWNEAGQPLQMMGTLHDITELRTTEQHLKIAAQIFSDAIRDAQDQIYLTTKVLESAIEGMVVTNGRGNVLSINPAFTHITGYTQPDILGKSAIDLLQTDHQPGNFIKQMWRTIRQTGQWRGEIWNRKKNGEPFPLLLTVTAIFKKNRKSQNYIGLFHDLTDIQQTKEALHYQTFHDTLTGLPKRELLQDRLQQTIRQARRSKLGVLVLVFNLDKFSNINHRLGFAIGDLLLQETAHRLKALMREGDTTSRLSGDSFGMIVREFKTMDDSVQVVRKLEEALTAPFKIQNQTIELTTSIGVAYFPEDGEDALVLLKNAEIAVSRAKKAGRGQCQFFTHTMGEQAERRLNLESAIKEALSNQEFILYYQPKVTLASHTIKGMEALVRWERPGIGLISPLEFIPLAESTGLILPLGEWILTQACNQIQNWHQTGVGSFRVAVNISPRQFQQKNFISTLEAILQKSGLSPHQLELEITEGMVMENVDEVIDVLTKIEEMGIGISMDDFGTGYSSLSYLKRFPIHTLKIDRSFISHLNTDSRDAAIVTATITMARGLGLSVVAEGVETIDQLNFLRDKGCDEIQGYYYSKPLDAENFIQFVKNHPYL